MPTYISLLKYTQQGITQIKESPNRLDSARQIAKSVRVEIKAFYLAMGQYDAVVILEAPNEEAVAKFMLMIGALGNVGTQTFRAFTEDEFRGLIGGLL